MQHGITLKSQEGLMSEYSSCLSQFRSFFKSLFSNGTSKIPEKCLLQFVYCFPLKVHQQKRKWCVQSVMPKLQWTNK